jgi:hypothetical protein
MTKRQVKAFLRRIGRLQGKKVNNERVMYLRELHNRLDELEKRIPKHDHWSDYGGNRWCQICGEHFDVPITPVFKNDNDKGESNQ